MPLPAQPAPRFEGWICTRGALGLFDGDGEKPQRLTAYDLAYLDSPCDGIPNIPAQFRFAGAIEHLEPLEADPQ